MANDEDGDFDPFYIHPVVEPVEREPLITGVNTSKYDGNWDEETLELYRYLCEKDD